MTRSNLRENVFKILFDLDFYDPEKWEEQAALFFEEREEKPSRVRFPDDEDGDGGAKATEEEKEHIIKKALDICAMAGSLDERIDKVSKGWRTGRMPKADLTILRLALYEIECDDEVPASVAINEAVELAKKFGTDHSPAFINGILARFAEDDSGK